MSAEPLSREERAHPPGWVPLIYDLRQAGELLDRYEATVQAAEAGRDAAMIAVVVTVTERNALARRVEGLRAALEGAEDFIERVAEWNGTDEDECQEVLHTIWAALADDAKATT